MSTETTQVVIHGHWAPQYGPAVDAFAANFRDGAEIGAAFAVRKGGEPVVDVWAGWADSARTRPWTKDTLVNVWSSTKGVNAACFAMLVDRGQVTYDEPVAKYWPEFAAAGKATISIGALLSHQAGLCGFTTPAVVEDLYAGSAAAARLAAQAPLWGPGGASGYHAISIGILAAELFKRITGTALKDFIAADLKAERGLDIRLGLAPDESERAAEMIAPASMSSSNLGSYTPPQMAALANPSLDPTLPNTPGWRGAELSSANGFTNARALADFYARLLNGDLIGPGALAEATAVRVEGVDLVLGLHARWAAGFVVNSDGIYGPNRRTFGHSGWGGSFGFADPDRNLTVAYTMNQMTEVLNGDPRGLKLIDSVYAVP